MELHKLLKRQLNKAKLMTDVLPDSLSLWQELLMRINKSYQEADQERYLLERSMSISSHEMMILNERLESAQHLAHMGYWSYDETIDRLWCSNEIYSLLSLQDPNALIIWKNFIDIIHKDDRPNLQKLIKKSLNKQLNFQCEVRIKTDDNFRWYRIIVQCGEKKQRLSGVIIDINKDKENEQEINDLNQKLLVIARQAGMSEVATTILHNIGNILNSANLSANLIKENLQQNYYQKFFTIIEMIKQNSGHLGEYLSTDKKGKLIPDYLNELSEIMLKEHQRNIDEINNLDKNLEYIKTVVNLQKTVGGVSEFSEKIFIPDLIDTAIKMSANPEFDKLIIIHKHYSHDPVIFADKSKLLQIFINLFQNAKDALLEDKSNNKKTINFSINEKRANKIIIKVADNGIGIPPEYSDRIFSFGFTTKKNGHGFGLHSAALSAQNMGGSLQGKSAGTGCGTEFVLTLPIKKQRNKSR